MVTCATGVKRWSPTGGRQQVVAVGDASVAWCVRYSWHNRIGRLSDAFRCGPLTGWRVAWWLGCPAQQAAKGSAQAARRSAHPAASGARSSGGQIPDCARSSGGQICKPCYHNRVARPQIVPAAAVA
eukprot:4385012-Pyramimonas_sp.AAC.1